MFFLLYTSHKGTIQRIIDSQPHGAMQAQFSCKILLTYEKFLQICKDTRLKERYDFHWKTISKLIIRIYKIFVFAIKTVHMLLDA